MICSVGDGRVRAPIIADLSFPLTSAPPAIVEYPVQLKSDF